MARIQHILTASGKSEYTGIILLVLIVLVLHLATITQPARPVFDEQYYVTSAQSILNGAGTGRIEHPPLGQLFIASGIWLFGDNPLGWRIFSVIFGLAGIVFLYLICRQLKMPPKYAYLAAFLFSFENLSFIQSSVAMLDVFSLTFMLGAFWLYLKGQYVSSGIIIGLAALSKLTGILVLPIIILHWILTNSRLISFLNPVSSPLTGEGEDEGVTSKHIPSLSLSPTEGREDRMINLLPQGERRIKLESSPSQNTRACEKITKACSYRQHLRRIIELILIAPMTFLLLMPLLDFIIWHKWLNPFSQVATMLHISVYSTFTRYPSTMLSRPWDWVLHPEILTYWINPHYLAMVSPPVWALIIPATVFIIFKALQGDAAAVFALVWFTGAYLAWIPFSLVSDRISYIYYFYPAIGAVCVALAIAAAELDNITSNQPAGVRERLTGMIVPVYLLLCLGAFAVLSPVAYWWKVPLCVLAYLASRHYMSRRPSEEIKIGRQIQNTKFEIPNKFEYPKL